MSNAPDHNPENAAKLATAVVESWDMDTLIEFAAGQQEAFYMEFPVMFNETAEDFPEAFE